MKYRSSILLLFIVLTTSANLSAQDGGAPLSFLPSDSISFIDGDVSNWHLFPLSEYGELTAKSVEVKKRSHKKDAKRWKKQVRKHPVNLVGGSGDESLPHQGKYAAEMTHIAARMFLHTGQSSYIDLMERALCNALPACVLQEKNDDKKTARLAAQTILDAAGTVYALRGDTVFLNFYQNCYAHIPMKDFDFTIDQVTGMPFAGRFKIRLGRVPHGGRDFVICLRLPEWLSERPEIYVNGHDWEYDTLRGYAVISRKWLNRDEVYFNFPELPFVQKSDDGATSFLRNRALIYAFPAIESIPEANPVLTRIVSEYDDGITPHPHYKVIFRVGNKDYEAIASPYLDVSADKRHVKISVSPDM